MKFRTFLTALALTLVGGITLHAQGWEQVYPSRPTNGIITMYHWSGDTIFAGGWNSTLLRSTSAGRTWETINLNTISLSQYCSYLAIRTMTSDGRYLYFTAMPSPVSIGYDPSVVADESYRCLLFRYDPATNTIVDLSVQRRHHTTIQTDYPIVRSTRSNLYITESNSTVGEESTTLIFRSSNGGSAWDTLSVTGILKQFLPVGDQLLLAVVNEGYRSSIVRSTNGGISWDLTHQMIHSSLDVIPICSFPGQNGKLIIMLGTGSSPSYSIDSGVTWESTAPITWDAFGTQSIGDLSWTTDGTVYVLGLMTDLFKTTDLGRTWNRVREPSLVEYYGSSTQCPMLTTDQDKLIIATKRGEFLRSEDDGLTWENDFFNPPRIITGIHFFDKLRGLVFGRDESLHYIMASTSDAGYTWSDAWVADGALFARVLWDISSMDTLYTYRTVPDNDSVRFSLLYSTNLGASWEEIYESWTHDSHVDKPVSLCGGVMYFSERLSDKFWYSLDRGRTWLYNDLPPDLKGRIVAHCTESATSTPRTFLYTLETTMKRIYRSDDLGLTWELKDSFSNTQASTIGQCFTLNADSLFIIVSGTSLGSSGDSYFLSTDAGDTWEIVYEQPYPAYTNHEIVFLPKIYTFDANLILRITSTDDFWQHTEPQLHRFAPDHSAYYFLNENIGWIAAGPAIFRTSNGGVDWVEQPFTIREDAAISSIYPNPVTAGQSATVNLLVPTQSPHVSGGRNAPLRVTVYDLLGRAVAMLYNGPAEPGTRTLTWEPAPSLPAGMYVVRMALGEKIWAKQVAFVK